MEIKDIDKNFRSHNLKISKKQIYKIPNENFKLHGLIYYPDDGFYRMDKNIAKTVNEGVDYLNRHTAGGRLVFATDSKIIKLRVKYKALETMHHMALTGQAGFSLNEKTLKGEKHVYTFGPEPNEKEGFEKSTPKLKGNKMRTYVLHFPLYNSVQDLEIELTKNAKFGTPIEYKNIDPVIFYGSSITQGGCASRSDNDYQDLALEEFNLDFINLGFSGNAKGEQEMAEYIGKQKCSCFVYDYDHNAPTPEHLEKTHEPFFKTFRKYQPNTPVIIMSRAMYTGSKDDKERWNTIYKTYQNALKNRDKNVYFLDGRYIYPKSVREHCTVDDAHPTDLGFYYTAKKLKVFLKKIFK